MSETLSFHPTKFIEEVKARPGLYDPAYPLDRTEKLELWKQVGAALFPQWNTYTKAVAYDRVLQLQKKWRSFRDAYNRELRLRRASQGQSADPSSRTRKVYQHFKRMSFLGGFEGELSSSEPSDLDEPKFLYPLQESLKEEKVEDTAVAPVKKQKGKKRRRRSTSSIQAAEEYEMPMPLFSSSDMADNDVDSDRLFLMSFAPEMRQLPMHLKMWARAQIANIMQEAVNSYCNNTVPRGLTESSVNSKEKPDLDLSD